MVRKIGQLFKIFKILTVSSFWLIFDDDTVRVCSCNTEKYRTAVFVQPELAKAVLKDQGPVFLSMARAFI